MSLDKAPKQINRNTQYCKIFVSSSTAGLAHSHKIIRTQKSMEAQFMKLCSQINLNDCKKQRADKQRDDRRQKRYDKHPVTIHE